MKYGVLEYKNPRCINIGDAMQIIAVLNLYQKIGIDEADIIRVNFYDLQVYDGEEVILPICFPFYGYNSQNKVTCFSPKIVPVFLSLSLFDTNLDNDEVEYLKKYEPIGCRDEFTAEGLAKRGLKTYLNGCMTLTLDTMQKESKETDIICVDIPDDINQYIPNDLKENIQKRTHIFNSIEAETHVFAKELLEEYACQAKLVITSRLHTALPCFAVGIPVIFIHSEYSYRFSWLENILPIYLPDEWNRIDWQGSCIKENDYAINVRTLMVEIAKERLLHQTTPYDQIAQLQQLYEARDKREYTRGPYDVSVKYINENWNKDKAVEYAVWGVSQVASALIDYIDTHYPSAKLVSVIDAAKTRPFKNHIPVKINEVERIKDLFVFVTADAVNPYAIDYFDEIEKSPTTYFMCWKHINTGGGIYQFFDLRK